MILPLLRDMRAQMAELFDKVATRLERMDETLVTFGHVPSADCLLSGIASGEFEERLELPERGMKALRDTERRVLELEERR